MNEVSISSARASVMVYDDVNKKWIPSGTSSGLSKVQLYHHLVNNTFRVVGRKLQDHEIVINCAILKGLKYNQATATFHQWRDNKQVYGLNFSSKDDADAFARAMLQALDVLSNGSNISRSLGPTVTPAAQQQPSTYPQQLPQQQQPQQQAQQQPQQQQQASQQQQPPQMNPQYDEDMGYSQAQVQDISTMGSVSRVSLSLGRLTTRATSNSSVPPTPSPNHSHPSISNGTTTVIQVGGFTPCTRGSPADTPMRTMTREDVAIIQERRMSQQSQPTNGPSAISPSCPPTTGQQQQQAQQQGPGHHRTSSAPPAPQPPVTALQQQQGAPLAAPIAPQIVGPPIPPPQPPAAPPAPPCPPSMMNFSTPVPPPMMTQYAQQQQQQQQQQTASQSSIPLQSQSQTIYATNQSGNYGNSGQQAGSQYNVNSQSQGQYTSAGLQQNSVIYGQNNGQNNGVYSQTGTVASQGGVAGPINSQYAINTSTASGQYPGNNNQYGSNNSINQYATGASQYASGQTQFGNVVQTTSQLQYQGNGQVVIATTNPYGTPSNTVNQYASVGAVAAAAAATTSNSNTYNPISNNSGPPPPPMGPTGGPAAAPPPPPPPPAPNANSAVTIPNAPSMGPGILPNNANDVPPDTNSLAAALQAARLKKKQQSQPVENSGSSTSSSGSGGGGGNYGTLGRGGTGGMASMMDEMAKTLARRRAAVEKKQPEQPPEPENSPDKKWDKSNSSNNKFSNGGESPKSARKRFGSASEDTLLKVNGVGDGASFSAQEMEAFKAEIIKEVRKEFQKMKQEIVDALKGELRNG